MATYTNEKLLCTLNGKSLYTLLHEKGKYIGELSEVCKNITTKEKRVDEIGEKLDLVLKQEIQNICQAVPMLTDPDFSHLTTALETWKKTDILSNYYSGLKTSCCVDLMYEKKLLNEFEQKKAQIDAKIKQLEHEIQSLLNQIHATYSEQYNEGSSESKLPC